MLSAEERELRRTRVGASEVGAVLGLDPYKTALDVFMSKMFDDNGAHRNHQEWGLDLEEPTLRFVVRQFGYELLKGDRPDGKWKSKPHPTLPLVCTPDALALTKDGSTIAIQAKNDQGHGQLQWGEPGTDDAPLAYVAQTVVEIGVLVANGYQVVRDDLAVTLRGAPPAVYPITFDPELFGQVAELCAKFVRDHLQTGKPPDAEPGDMAEYVKRRWARHGEHLLQPTPELTALVQQVVRLRAQTKALKEELTFAENALKTAIGESAGIVGLCTWKLQKGSTYQVTKAPSRVLRLIGAKEE